MSDPRSGVNWGSGDRKNIPAGPGEADDYETGFGFPFTVDPGMVRSSDFLALAANSCVYGRCRDGGTITKVGLQIVTSSGNVSVAAYRNSGNGRSAVPASRLATSGAVACPAAGYAEIALGGAVTLAAGDWLALSADNNTATFRSLLGGTVDSNLGLGRQFRQDTAHPLPAAPGTLVGTTGWTIVLIGIA